MPEDEYPPDPARPVPLRRDHIELHTNAQYAEFGAFILDAYQAGVMSEPAPDHRTDPTYGTDLLGDLLGDLMHYADQYKVDFETAAVEASSRYLAQRSDEAPYRPGTLVQLTQDAADDPILAGLPRRGVITGLRMIPGKPTAFAMRSPGEPEGHWYSATDLEPAPAFRPIPTNNGIIDTPLQAEQALVETVARIGLADLHQQPADHHDIEDHHALLIGLEAWSGTWAEQLTDKLGPRFEEALQALEYQQPSHTVHPAHLADRDFPFDPNCGGSEPGYGDDTGYRPGGPAQGHGRRPR